MTRFTRGAALAAALITAAPFASMAMAQDAALPADQAAPAMSLDAKSFVPQAKAGNLFEIESSKLVADKAAGDADLKRLADMLIADHSAAETTLESIEAGAPVLPVKLQMMLDQLKAAQGADFRTLYIDIQAQAHMEAIMLFRTYAGSGENADLVAFAKEALPKLEMHMQAVKGLIAKL